MRVEVFVVVVVLLVGARIGQYVCAGLYEKNAVACLVALRTRDQWASRLRRAKRESWKQRGGDRDMATIEGRGRAGHVCDEARRRR